MEDKRNDDWISLPANETQLQRLFVKGKRHPAMKMANIAMNMKRSPKQVFILMVGLSGAGKSSTANYLFETNIAETSEVQSMTQSTTEYTVHLKSKEWRIRDLPLSIIDTPGFNDTQGLEQDAKNLMSIKYFLESHQYLKHNYPNLVMIMLNITDNRIEGDSSNFAKMLKGISTVNAIDNRNPNVVVVLTHATSIARNRERWIEKVEMKKAKVQAIVQVHLGIVPEIVVQENQPEENDLDRVRDWFLLPNGDKQPKILYKACEHILNKTTDEIGHEAVAVCFRPGMEKKIVKIGLIVPSSQVKTEDYQIMHTTLLKSVVTTLTSEVSNMLEDYKKKKNVAKFDNDILILQVKFRDLGITDTSELQELTMNRLSAKLHPTKISPEMQEVLKDVFGLSYEQSSGLAYHVGKGYNIFKDSATQFSPLVLEVDNQNENGPPANVHIIYEPSLEVKCEMVNGAKAYVNQRLKELKIGAVADISYGVFDLQLRAGYTDINRSNGSATANLDTSSFSIEHKIKKVVVKQPYKISQEFKDDVEALPTEYDMNDENSFMEWNAFFEKWGMHVVTGGYIGGSLTGQIKVEETQSKNSTFAEANAALNLKLNFLERGKDLKLSKEEGDQTMNEGSSRIFSTKLKWDGGNSPKWIQSLDTVSRNDWEAWVESLKYTPVPLWSSLDLYPIYQLASTVNRIKGTEMQRAMNLALTGDFIFEPEDDDDDRTNTAKSNDSKSCFHEDCLVMLHNRKLRRMKELSVGDKILTINSNGTISQDEIIAWLHQVKDGQFTFLQIVHEFGKITLTPEHIIFVGKSQNPQHASSIKPGDKLSFFTNDNEGQTVTMAIVLSIHKVEGRGIYAPLTYSGRLLVDKVDVSCYCTLNPLKVLGNDIISSHALAHAGFLPLRMAFKFGLNISSNKLNDETGIHGYAQWLMSVILGE